MPTFYRPSNRRTELAAVVWNPRANAALADFSIGNQFQTDDPYVIQKLRALGYPTVEEYEAQQGNLGAPSPPPHELKPRPPATREVPLQEGKRAVKQKSPTKKEAPAGKLKRRTASPQPPDAMDSDVSPSD